MGSTYYVTFKVEGRYTAEVDVEPSDTLSDILKKGRDAYYNANFGELENCWLGDASVYNANDKWYQECNQAYVPDHLPLEYTGKMYVYFQVLGHWETSVEANKKDTLESIMEKAEAYFSEADFAGLEDIGDGDCGIISVENEYGGLLFEDGICLVPPTVEIDKVSV